MIRVWGSWFRGLGFFCSGPQDFLCRGSRVQGFALSDKYAGFRACTPGPSKDMGAVSVYHQTKGWLKILEEYRVCGFRAVGFRG